MHTEWPRIIQWFLQAVSGILFGLVAMFCGLIFILWFCVELGVSDPGVILLSLGFSMPIGFGLGGHFGGSMLPRAFIETKGDHQARRVRVSKVTLLGLTFLFIGVLAERSLASIMASPHYHDLFD